MEKKVITKLRKTFEDHAHEEDGVEFWFARDLQALLGYSKWENFNVSIRRAKEACKTSGQAILDHFPEVRKTIAMQLTSPTIPAHHGHTLSSRPAQDQ